MADTLGNLGQALPASGVLATLYTVPSATSAVVSTLFVTNESGAQTTFRISYAVAGAADTLTQYLYYDTKLPANDTLTITVGISMAATDVIRVQSGNGQVNFQAFGVQVT